MPGVVTKDMNCSGHATYPPRLPTEWSPNVFANGKNVVRYGDNWQAHCCPPVCHGGVSIGGGSVFVNSQVIQIEGDPISCGSVCAEHSGNVFAKGS